MIPLLRFGLVRAAFVAALFSCSALLASAAEAVRAFDVPAGDAAATLKQAAKQGGVEIVFPAATVSGVQTAPVKGDFTAREAINRMLADTDLVLVQDEKSGVLSVQRLASDEKNDASRLANAQTASAAKVAGARINDGVLQLDAFEVFGRKTLNVDVRRDRDDAQPYVIFSSEDLERQGAFNLEGFLRSRLPMNTQVGSNSQLPGAGAGNSSGINLRGLGEGQTLILVDGRRLPGVGSGGAVSQPDINGLPISSIERIEILPTTAGGIYGGGATGGVINIITRRDYKGVELRTTYGNAFNSDASITRVDLSAGFSLAQGRTDVLLNASHTRSTPLMVGERDFGLRARQLLLANNPTAFYSLATPPSGNTPNIRSVNGSNLVLTNGTALNSPRTFIPVGYGGISSDGGAALVANAGNYNLNLAEDAGNARRSLLWSPEVESYTFNVRHQFSSAVEAYVDFSYSKNKSTAIGATAFPTATTLPVGAPNNPFTTPIRVSFPVTNVEIPISSTTETRGGLAGVIVKLPHDWLAVGEASRRISSASSASSNPEINATALSSGALDVMRDLNRFPLAYGSNLVNPLNSSGPMDVVLDQASVRTSGPLFEVRGKTITLNASLERRKEESQEAFSEFNLSNGSKFITLYPVRSQRVDAAFLEVRMPLVDKTSALPFVRELEVTASVRYDKYRTTAPAPSTASLSAYTSPRPAFTYAFNEAKEASYTLAVRHDILDGLAFRASIGTGFLPPNISQLVRSFNPSFTGFGLDPKRENVRTFWATPLALTQGGNPSLEPESSTSISAGVVIAPQWLHGVRLSADYTRIEKTDEIRGLTLQQAIDFEDSLPGRVTRAPLTPADIAAGYTGGAITAMDISLSNVADTLVEAFDFQADFAPNVPRGRLNVYARATLQNHSRRRLTPGLAAVNSVGFSNGELRWRGNMGFDYEISNWSFGWNAQYYHSYLAFSAGSSAAVISAAVLNQGSDTIPRQIYHDLYGKYRFSAGASKLLRRTELGISIENVFNGVPPALASTAGNLGYSQYGDPRLRRYTLSLRKNF